MQKCLFSAPDGPGGPGTRETAEAVVVQEAATGPEVPVSTDSTAPSLVWPPSDEDLDDWHVLTLKGREAEAASQAAGAKSGTANGTNGTNGANAGGAVSSASDSGPGAASGLGNGNASGASRKPLPAWLANHRAAKSGGLTAVSSGTPGAPSAEGVAGAPGLNLAVPKPVAPSPSGSALRAVTASPLEDTARFSSDTTTAITAIRNGSLQAASTPGSVLNLATVAQPSVPARQQVAAFPAERRRPMPVPAPAPSIWNGNVRRGTLVLLAVLAAGQAAYIGVRLVMTPDAASTSVLTVDSVPDGATVLIDGEARGVTPFKVELTAGSHSLQLRKDGRTRTIPLVLAAGVQASQYVELSGAPSSSATSSGPSAAPRAAAPASGTPAAAGPTSPDGTAAAAVPPPSYRGWVVIESALNLSVLRNGEMLGSSEEGRLALPAGRQELELVNDAVGYRAVMTVQVPPGRPLTVPVELPQSLLNVSATPSARVWVDGREVGGTPITQLALPVGQHEVRFEHPEYGERRMTVLVKVGMTAQAAVDFTR